MYSLLSYSAGLSCPLLPTYLPSPQISRELRQLFRPQLQEARRGCMVDSVGGWPFKRTPFPPSLSVYTDWYVEDLQVTHFAKVLGCSLPHTCTNSCQLVVFWGLTLWCKLMWGLG